MAREASTLQDFRGVCRVSESVPSRGGQLRTALRVLAMLTYKVFAKVPYD